MFTNYFVSINLEGDLLRAFINPKKSKSKSKICHFYISSLK